jgi:hypothetical protein
MHVYIHEHLSISVREGFVGLFCEQETQIFLGSIWKITVSIISCDWKTAVECLGERKPTRMEMYAERNDYF